MFKNLINCYFIVVIFYLQPSPHWDIQKYIKMNTHYTIFYKMNNFNTSNMSLEMFFFSILYILSYAIF